MFEEPQKYFGDLSGKTVMDLGAGTGYLGNTIFSALFNSTGSVCAYFGAKVLLTDLEEQQKILR